MSQSNNHSSLRLLIIGLLALVVGTTIGLFFVFTEAPRSLFAISVVFFLCLIESGVGLAVLTGWAAPSGRRVSSAAKSITIGALTLYAIVGLLTILVRGAVPSSDNPSDSKYLAILFAEGVCFFVGAAIVSGLDLHHADQEHPREAVDLRNQNADALATALAALDALHVLETPELARVDRLKKEFYALKATLARSPLGAEDTGDTAMLYGKLAQLASGLRAAGDLDGLETLLQQLKGKIRPI